MDEVFTQVLCSSELLSLSFSRAFFFYIFSSFLHGSFQFEPSRWSFSFDPFPGVSSFLSLVSPFCSDPPFPSRRSWNLFFCQQKERFVRRGRLFSLFLWSKYSPPVPSSVTQTIFACPPFLPPRTRATRIIRIVQPSSLPIPLSHQSVN